MLNWQGRRVRIELSYDMYSAEYKLAKRSGKRINFENYSSRNG